MTIWKTKAGGNPLYKALKPSFFAVLIKVSVTPLSYLLYYPFFWSSPYNYNLVLAKSMGFVTRTAEHPAIAPANSGTKNLVNVESLEFIDCFNWN